jgi:hypothetical protein
MRPDEGGFSLSHCGHAYWTLNPIESGADRDAAAAAASMRLVPRRIRYSQCSFIHAHVAQHGGPLSEVRGNGAVVSTCSSSIHVPQHLRAACYGRGEGEQRPAVGSAACKCSPRSHLLRRVGGSSRGRAAASSRRRALGHMRRSTGAPSLRLGLRYCASGSVIAPRAPSLRLGLRHCASGSGSACASSLLPSASRLRRRPLAEATRAAPGVVGDRPIGGTVPRLSVCSCKPPRGGLRTAGEGPLAGIWSSVP